ncbi:hypothetical protein QN277_001706 [Acacia crassicarpa]|uniref:DM2 domain-containing protein n=1 Tax=Acacia crassicarpa TaxID=499986 RepID=A0AAE1TH36_9FABA|nr:hypothetical protein QN277_001706 [Acacia crassicarpa]
MSSSSIASFRVIRGCKALLAPLKSSSSASNAKTTQSSSKSKPKGKNTPQKPHSRSSSSTSPQSSPKPRRELTRPTGILKATPVSPVLHRFLGVSEASRGQAVKQVWAYVKLHNLQNPVNRSEIECDEKLKSLFEGKDKVGFLEVGKLLSRHFQKN